jgi:hypothetical protein
MLDTFFNTFLWDTFCLLLPLFGLTPIAVVMTTPKIASALISRSWKPWRCLDLTLGKKTNLRLSNTYIINFTTQHCILFLL